jgi:hypothetical protein
VCWIVCWGATGGTMTALLVDVDLGLDHSSLRAVDSLLLVRE